MTRHEHDATERRRIAPLSELDGWELKDGEPDVRGWEVVTDRGARVGEVHELLADPSARRVRYLEVELDGNEGIDRRVAFPIGTARIEEDGRRVRLGASEMPASELPRYGGGVPDRSYEQRVASCYGCDERSVERYEHPAFDDRAFYRR